MVVTQAEKRRQQMIDESTAAFRSTLDRLLTGPVESDDAALSEHLGQEGAEYAVRVVAPASLPSVSTRIGAVYTIEDLAKWLPGGPVTHEAIRQRAERRTIVAFRTTDKRWAAPAWQFRPAAGRLVAVDEVITLWQSLPHDDTFLTDADLVGWMSTRLQTLDGHTPADWAATHGHDDRLRAAVSRLAARAA